ncbi:MAG: GNAT family N-acetyltransferase [Elusimicrobiota bacterium]
MKRSIQLKAPGVVLTSVAKEDVEELRLWKNEARATFFYKKEISQEEQENWYRGYLTRDDDQLFSVQRDGRRAGFIGVRMKSNDTEVYAVIARPQPEGRRLLGPALRLAATYAAAGGVARVFCRILKDDSIRDWFIAEGFRVAAEKADHVELEPDPARFRPLRYEYNAVG